MARTCRWRALHQAISPGALPCAVGSQLLTCYMRSYELACSPHLYGLVKTQALVEPQTLHSAPDQQGHLTYNASSAQTPSWWCHHRCDGPLLRAIRSGAWVLLDELNLANQSVLEGLNSVLDHRAEVFIPELGTAYRCAPGFRLFAAQNPLQEVTS